MKASLVALALMLSAVVVAVDASQPEAVAEHRREHAGRRLFERETFGGNGRTCLTCHSRDTGTVSPEDARRRFRQSPDDPLFVHDGSDDGLGHGVTRMLTDATVLITIPLPPNVTLADDPSARTVVVRRGIASTLNTPALDPVLMLDGRQPTLESQAAGAIVDHAQGVAPSFGDLHIDDPTLEHVNAFKISPLRGIRHTAPYFHDNSAKTLADVAAHYALFFEVVTGGAIVLTPQDQRDIVAFMRLLE